MAVVVGEAAVRIRPETEGFEDEASGGILDSLTNIGGKGAALLGGLVGGAALAAAFGTALENSALNDKLAAQLGLSSADAERVGGVAGELYAHAYGDNLGEVNDAVAAVMGSIGGMNTASSADLQAVTANALDFSKAMGVDVSEAATSAGALVKSGLAANAKEAFDLMTVGAQQAGPAMVAPILDATNEYAGNFAAMGYSGEQAMALLVDASAGGEIAVDKIGDAVKEFSIRATDMSASSVAAYDTIGLSAEDMSNKLLAGGTSAQDATQQIVAGLQGIEDPATKANTAIALFGTPLEDMGVTQIPAFLDSLSMANGELEGVAGAADRMGTTLNDNASGNLTTFTRSIQTGIVDFLGGKVVPAVEGVSGILVSSLGPAFSVIGSVMTDTVGPALSAAGGFITEFQTPLTIIAALVGAVFIPAMVTMAASAVTSAAVTAGTWIATQASAIASAASQGLAFAAMVAGWVVAGATAIVNAAIVVGGWVLMGAQALLGAAQMAAAWLIALGPIALVIAAVIGVVALIVANWDTIVSATQTAWDAVMGAIAAAWEWIKGAFSAALQFVVDVFMNWTLLGLIIKHWDDIKAAFSAGVDAAIAFVTGLPQRAIDALASLGAMIADVATKAWQWYNDNVNTKVREFLDFVAGIPGKVIEGLASLGSSIAGAASAAWQWYNDNVNTKIREMLDFVGGIPGKVVSAVGNLGGLLVQKGKDLIQGLVDGIASAAGYVGNVAKNIVNGVIRFVNTSIIGGLNSMLQFDIAGIHIDAPDIPRIPTLHSGGVFDSGQGEGLALLRDQELVATPEQRVIADNLLRGLLDGRLALPAAATAGPAAGPQVNIEVNAAPGMDEREVAAHVSTDLAWRLSAGATSPVALLGAPS